MWEAFKNEQIQDIDKSFDDSNESDNEDGSIDDAQSDDASRQEINYFPNELLKYSNRFENKELEAIYESNTKTAQFDLINDFFRAVTLCHQCQVIKDKKVEGKDNYRYFGIFNDEITSVEFAKQKGYQLIYRKKKLIRVNNNGSVENYDELGLVETKAVQGHFLTICAVRVQGTKTGIIYMKGSIASLKQYLAKRDTELLYLDSF